MSGWLESVRTSIYNYWHPEAVLHGKTKQLHDSIKSALEKMKESSEENYSILSAGIYQKSKFDFKKERIESRYDGSLEGDVGQPNKLFRIKFSDQFGFAFLTPEKQDELSEFMGGGKFEFETAKNADLLQSIYYKQCFKGDTNQLDKLTARTLYEKIANFLSGTEEPRALYRKFAETIQTGKPFNAPVAKEGEAPKPPLDLSSLKASIYIDRAALQQPELPALPQPSTPEAEAAASKPQEEITSSVVIQAEADKGAEEAAAENAASAEATEEASEAAPKAAENAAQEEAAQAAPAQPKDDNPITEAAAKNVLYFKNLLESAVKKEATNFASSTVAVYFVTDEKNNEFYIKQNLDSGKLKIGSAIDLILANSHVNPQNAVNLTKEEFGEGVKVRIKPFLYNCGFDTQQVALSMKCAPNELGDKLKEFFALREKVTSVYEAGKKPVSAASTL